MSTLPADRHEKRDRSAPSRLAGNPHVPAVKQGNALYDRKAQAGASRTLGAGGIDTKEAIENLRQGFGWNADACIGDSDANRGRVGVRPQYDGSAGRRVR